MEVELDRGSERSGVRRLLCLIGLGCLLGAATASETTLALAAPASAQDCFTQHHNVVGSTANLEYGAKGWIYVNTSTVINSLHDSLYRSFYGWRDAYNFVEVGWGAGPNNISGNSGPTVYAYWQNSSTPGQFVYKSLSDDTDYRFRLENVGDIYIWRFVFGSESSPFAYSPTMSFNQGYSQSNSEHYSSCDSLYDHHYDLSYYTYQTGSWSSDWGNWYCNFNNTVDWYLHKDSASELHVTQNGSGALSCP